LLQIRDFSMINKRAPGFRELMAYFLKVSCPTPC